MPRRQPGDAGRAERERAGDADPGRAARCRNPLASLPAAQRVLVIRLGAVGDVVRTLPAARRLREAWPQARLAWLVEPASASVLAGQPWIDALHVFPRAQIAAALRALRLAEAARVTRGFVRALRAERFDLVVDFHAILKSGLLARATGARTRVSYAPPFAREAAWLFATERAQVVPRRVSRFARNAALVDFLGAPAADAARPLVVPAASRAALDRQLGPDPFVALHPGTSDGTPHKRWTVEGYAALARALAREPGIGSLVTVGPARSDPPFAEAIVAAAQGAARLAPPTPSLLDLAALLERARLYVGSDTGPLHVASLVGTPAVQLLGPTDPVENAPWPVTPARSVRVPVACSPCRRGCAAAPCMRVIRPERVLEAARALLAPGAPSRPA